MPSSMHRQILIFIPNSKVLLEHTWHQLWFTPKHTRGMKSFLHFLILNFAFTKSTKIIFHENKFRIFIFSSFLSSHCANVVFTHFNVFLVSTTSSGGLFDDESKDTELAFRFAVQAINNQRNKQTDGLLEAGELMARWRPHFMNDFFFSLKALRVRKSLSSVTKSLQNDEERGEWNRSRAIIAGIRGSRPKHLRH